jgi:hypothetical protein
VALAPVNDRTWIREALTIARVLATRFNKSLHRSWATVSAMSLARVRDAGRQFLTGFLKSRLVALSSSFQAQ